MTNSNDSSVWRLDSLTCTNFKAFKKLDIKINGRNVLIYGKNGSGKSSLYEAIKFFIDSATYNHVEQDNLLSRYTRLNSAHRAENKADIEVSLGNYHNQAIKELTYRIGDYTSDDSSEIMQIIKKGRLASDFITYRVLYDFYTVREHNQINLWPIFYKEILPFCISSNPDIYHEITLLIQRNFAHEIQERREEIEHETIELRNRAIYESDDDYSDPSDDITEHVDPVEEKLNELKKINDELVLIIDGINKQANSFYTRHFNDSRNIKLDIGISEFTLDKNYMLIEPKLYLTITHSGTANLNPLVYLNEATLTQIALSVRLGASLMMLNRDTYSTKSAELKLLVIDDLLISLDISNRMKVIEILLGPDFADFQKIILTHDIEFFKEIQRRTYHQHTQWEILEVNHENSKRGCSSRKNSLQKAEDYLYGYIDDKSADLTQFEPDLDAAGVNMRKSAESLIKMYDHFSNSLNNLVIKHQESISKEFGLAKDIRNAYITTMNAIPIYLYYEYLRDITAEELRLVIPNHVHDVDENDKKRIRELREKLYKNFAGTPWRLVRNLDVILKLDSSRNRILNNAAHDNDTPQYKADFEETLQQLKTFTRIVHDPDMTAPLMRFEQSQIEPIDPAVETNPGTTPSQPPVPPGALQVTSKPNAPSQPPQSGPTVGVSSFQSPATNGPTRGRLSTLSADGFASESAITDESIYTPKSSLGADQNDNTQYLSDNIWRWLNTFTFATIDSTISMHTDVMSLDRETRLTQRIDYGIAFYDYLIPVQVIDKVDESSILHNFTNKTMLTVYTNNVKNDITVKPTSLGILIDGDKLELRSYPKGAYDGTHSVIRSLNMKDDNSTRLLYNELLNILL